VTTSVYLDSETTHLDYRLGHMWELALIVEGHYTPELDGEHLFTWPEVDLRNADPAALRIGGFYQRTAALLAAHGASDVVYTLPWRPQGAKIDALIIHLTPSKQVAASQIATLTAGAVLIGCRPEFDVDFIAKNLRENGAVEAWDYHTIDVAQVTLGRLNGKIDRTYRSDDLAAALDVTPPTREERHTALGDARWVKRWMDALDAGKGW
jgi:hypothetical protein